MNIYQLGDEFRWRNDNKTHFVLYEKKKLVTHTRYIRKTYSIYLFWKTISPWNVINRKRPDYPESVFSCCICVNVRCLVYFCYVGFCCSLAVTVRRQFPTVTLCSLVDDNWVYFLYWGKYIACKYSVNLCSDKAWNKVICYLQLEQI